MHGISPNFCSSPSLFNLIPLRLFFFPLSSFSPSLMSLFRRILVRGTNTSTTSSPKEVCSSLSWGISSPPSTRFFLLFSFPFCLSFYSFNFFFVSQSSTPFSSLLSTIYPLIPSPQNVQKTGLNYPVITDGTKELSTFYGMSETAFGNDPAIVPINPEMAVFAIDPEMKFIYHGMHAH